MSLRFLGVMVTTTVLIVAFGVSPASAGQDVGVSRDGRNWHDSLSQPLFDPAKRWVPGDRGTARFFVRNRGPSDSALSLQVTVDDTDGLLANQDFDLTVRVGEGRWQPITHGGTTRPVDGRRLARAANTPVDVRADFDPESPNRSQRKELPIQVTVTLVQSASDDQPDSEPSSGVLAETGATIPPWLVWMAAILIGAGAAVIHVGRRELPHA